MIKICEVRVGLCGGVVGGKELVLQLVEVLHRNIEIQTIHTWQRNFLKKECATRWCSK